MTDNEKDMREESPQDSEVTAAPEAGDDTVTGDLEAAGDEAAEAASEEKPYEWVEPPVFDVEEKEDCQVSVKVTIPVVNITAALDDVYDELNDGIQVPGFRRGKAPRKLLEKRMGKYARSAVVERLVEAASDKLIKDKELRPISEVDAEGLEDAENIPEDKDLVYTLQFEVAGKCELADYTQFELKKPEFQVEQKDVDEAIETMRMRFGRYEPLTEGGAEDGDQVIVDFKGTINGEAFEGNNAENYPYILGTNRFHENMEAVMRGAKTGDSVEAEVPFPEDHQNEALAGKTARYQITINEIKRRTLPALDDALAQKLGHDTVAELQESVRKQISENADSQLANMLHEQAMQKLVEESVFALPKKQVQRFIDGEYESLKEDLVKNHVSAEEIEKEEESIREAAERQGLFDIKSMYAINAVCEKEHIDVTEADLEAYARSLSGNDDRQFELMKEYLAREDIRTNSVYRILTNKALDTIVKQASIELVPFQEDEEEEDSAVSEDDAGEQENG